MKCNLNFTRRLRKNDEGATAIEYGLLAALIAVVIIGAVSVLGKSIGGTFTTVHDYIEDPDKAPVAPADPG